MKGLRYVRGERLTRAGPKPRAEAALSSAAGNRPWGGTRAGPRGAVTKWSGRGETVRFWEVARQRGALVLYERVACGARGRSGGLQTDKLVGPCAWLPGSGVKMAIVDNRGNTHVVRIGWSEEVTGRYKLCENRPGCNGGAGCLSCVFGVLSISRVRLSSWKEEVRSVPLEANGKPRGVTVVGG